MFVHADFHAAKLDIDLKKLDLSGITFLIGSLDGVTPTTYGRLEYIGVSGGLKMLYPRAIFPPGAVRLALEIQTKVMEFLLKCCYTILRDMTPTSLIGPNIPVKPERPAITRDPTEWLTVAAMAAEAPYRLPSNIGFERLQALFAAERSAMADEIWAFREDPGYYQEEIKHSYDELQEAIRDGSKAPFTWSEYYCAIIRSEYSDFLAADHLYHMVVNLSNLERKYPTVRSPSEGLPAEYKKALAVFARVLSERIDDRIRITLLKHTKHLSKSTGLCKPEKGNEKDETVEDRLCWLFELLGSEEPHMWNPCSKIIEPFGILNEIERLLQRHRGYRKRVPRVVSSTISRFGLFCEALSRQYFEEINAAYVTNVPGIQALFKHLNPGRGFVHPALEQEPDERFYYPSDKRRTPQRMEVMRKAEQNLDLFWKTIDEYSRGNTGQTLQEAFHHLLPGDRYLERTPEWVAKSTSRSDLIFHQRSHPYIHTTEVHSSSVPRSSA
ncbi:hypothetical protein AJ79_08229 [Helicocarpus griseus UAMH5409]|uniref:Uncharacterized protein n=1 Tax=Helicocarpus griseus UAMH5409 TaxID=1447875 RepID=A0A2B7WV00_9EURO|nr:hypothetical protein AJ79_08229 [Helicocarpus griseus UAMH5409]